MTLRDDIRAVQRRLGVVPDGVPGPQTFSAMGRALDELAGFKASVSRGTNQGPAERIEPGSSKLGHPSAPEAHSSPSPSSPMRLSDKGAALIHSFEQCRLTAYPDPGSDNGEPWTIGWGATGPGIARGVTWTQQQADERFKADIAGRERRLNQILAGTPTTQAQFDAMLSLGYNIGMDALAGSTVMRRHKAGDHEGAATAFPMWVKNDGKTMRGLVRRRAAEAEMYRGKP